MVSTTVLFYNDRVLEHVIRRLVDETERLQGEVILIGECGHASRSAKYYVPQFGGESIPASLNFWSTPQEAMHEGRTRAGPECRHRTGDLSRPMQHRPLGVDGRTADARS